MTFSPVFEQMPTIMSDKDTSHLVVSVVDVKHPRGLCVFVKLWEFEIQEGFVLQMSCLPWFSSCAAL